ncbi:phosphoglycerate kinase, partial [candidate division WWE3 bacterium RBG_13_37_7]
EITVLSKVLSNAEKPLVVIIGGAKIEDKLPVIEKFLKIADLVLLGGKLSQEWKGSVASNLRLPIDYALEKKDIGPKTIASYL